MDKGREEQEKGITKGDKISAENGYMFLISQCIIHGMSISK